MMRTLIAFLACLLTGCSSYQRPRIPPAVPEREVENKVDSIQSAAEVLIGDLLAQRKITERIRVALMPVKNHDLDAGVSVSLRNALLDELVSHDVFSVIKDLDARTIQQALAMEHEARGFLDAGKKADLGQQHGADAVITCTVSDSNEYLQIQVDLTPITSNVVATSATCYLPKRIVLRSLNYR